VQARCAWRHCGSELRQGARAGAGRAGGRGRGAHARALRRGTRCALCWRRREAGCAWGPAQERRRQEDEDEELARAIAASLGQEVPPRGAATAPPAPPAPLAPPAPSAPAAPPGAAPGGAAPPQQKGARALAVPRARSQAQAPSSRSIRCSCSIPSLNFSKRPAGSFPLWQSGVTWEKEAMPMCLFARGSGAERGGRARRQRRGDRAARHRQ